MSVNKAVPIVMLLLLLVVVYPVSAEYPKLTGYVNDFAGLLTPTEKAQLADQIGAVEKATTVQIAIVTVQTTNGEDIVLYGAHTGEQNGVGQKDTNNGVVIAMAIGDRNFGISTGRGIGDKLTDATCAQIRRGATPYFSSGNYYQGFSYIVSEINKKLTAPNSTEPVVTVPPVQMSPAESTALLVGAFIFMLIVVGLFAIASRRSSRSSVDEDDHHDHDLATAAAMGAILASSRHHYDDDNDYSSGSHSDFHFGGSGGFGGFGGGSFGGGGAGGHF